MLAMVLTTLGSCGTVTGLIGVQMDPYVPVGEATDDATDEENLAQARDLVADAVLRSPYRKPLAGANVVVSILLFWAGFSLIRRRKTATWWVSQGALANAFLVLVESGAQWHAITSHWEEIVGWNAEIGLTAGNTFLVTLAVTTVMRLAVYAWILWRVKRPDLQTALREAD